MRSLPCFSDTDDLLSFPRALFAPASIGETRSGRVARSNARQVCTVSAEVFARRGLCRVANGSFHRNSACARKRICSAVSLPVQHIAQPRGQATRQRSTEARKTSGGVARGLGRSVRPGAGASFARLTDF